MHFRDVLTAVAPAGSLRAAVSSALGAVGLGEASTSDQQSDVGKPPLPVPAPAPAPEPTPEPQPQPPRAPDDDVDRHNECFCRCPCHRKR